MRGRSIAVIAVLACLGSATMSARATSFVARGDLEFVAIDVAKGRVLWTFSPERTGDAHCEVYPRVVVLYLAHPQHERTRFVVLDRTTGRPVQEAPPRGQRPLARSSVFHPRPPVVTRSGLELRGLSEGNTEELKFYRKQGERPAAIVRPARWPYNVCASEDLVIFDHGALADEAIIYAHDVGAPDRPKWTLDLNRHITGSPTPTFRGLDRHVEGRKTRMFKQMLDGKLYVNAEEHLFCVDPASGKILWQRNMAGDLGLRFVPDFFGGGLNIAPMAKEKDVLVVAFENRIVAYDEKMKRFLWWMMPDTFPHTPFPALHDGVLYVTAGRKRQIRAIAP